MEPTSRIEISLAAIEHNLGTIRLALATSGQEGTPLVCAVLKADSYGLGAVPIAIALERASVDSIALYTTRQAVPLIEAGVETPLLILKPVRTLDHDPLIAGAIEREQLHFAVHDAPGLEALADIAGRAGATLPLHLEVDSGMSRGGVSISEKPGDASVLIARINEHPNLRLAGIYTHFASADSDAATTASQHDRFGRWLDTVADSIPRDCIVHEANSFALFRAPAHHRGMARAGLALFGYASEEFADPENFRLADRAAELKHAVRWMSSVIQVKNIPAGATVGYGSTWRAERPTRLALVPVGYSDGYPLALSSNAHVGFPLDDGTIHYAPVVGRISMDQLTADITDLPAPLQRLGATVEIVGTNPAAPNALPTLAKNAGTITHELLCRLNPRLPRQYLDGAGDARVAAESLTTDRA